jgi:hypothetical protein
MITGVPLNKYSRPTALTNPTSMDFPSHLDPKRLPFGDSIYVQNHKSKESVSVAYCYRVATAQGEKVLPANQGNWKQSHSPPRVRQYTPGREFLLPEWEGSDDHEGH